jgi:hypothetical protein
MFDQVKKRMSYLFTILFFYFTAIGYAQSTVPADQLWHGKQRELNYRPSGTDIVIVNGKHRFNRAIYGTNTAFRVEAGDLPEFGLYLPGMGGNLRFGLVAGSHSKWLINAQNITASYRAGSMIYTIRDAMLGNGTLNITVLAGAASECMLVKVQFINTSGAISLFWAYGGVTGKKFSRDGDLGADPESSFYLKPEYCLGNRYQVGKNSFILNYTGAATSEADRYEIKQPGINAAKAVEQVNNKNIKGIYPPGAEVRIADAAQQQTPLLFWEAKAAEAPALTGLIRKQANPYYFLIQSPEDKQPISYSQLPSLFNEAEAARRKLAGRIVVNTPEPYINTLGGVLSVAADAIWEAPSYMHGAVAWRMRLNAWRGPYVADVLGWHDRARSHFSSYALSQITSPESGPVVADTALHIARQQEKLGTSMFSSGYISRNPGGKIVPHHYDMNLVYIDALLNHFQWTGDLAYVKQMWPVLTRHLAWEKRNFDADGDGLYDAYCAIWASDALQYSGGGVTHSSAYNYRANKVAAYLATLIGKDPKPYQQEADHILKAINTKLWMPATGQYAEYQDLLGLKQLHPSAGLWTVYHAIDSEVPDAFQAYQALRYVDTEIPHIPVIAKGAPDGMYTLSTTNWMPYTWSLNNVALAELLHTSLAYWQGGRAEDAYTLWKSSLINSMFLEDSPGNFDQLSFYDAQRGELYRDFGDPIGMAGRSLVEGLFGIHPDALAGTLTIKPGFPVEWDHASLHTPDIDFSFKETGGVDAYHIVTSFPKLLNLVLKLPAKSASIQSVTVNGKAVRWNNIANAIETPMLRIECKKSVNYEIKIRWAGQKIGIPPASTIYPTGEDHGNYYDPQGVLKMIAANQFDGGTHTLFKKMSQGQFYWWSPVNVELKHPIDIKSTYEQSGKSITFTITNNTAVDSKAKITVNNYVSTLNINPGNTSADITIPQASLTTGSNAVKVQIGDKKVIKNIVNWNIPLGDFKQEPVNINAYFNDQLTNIFKNKYLSPRPKSATLQLPWQGIGNWCYPLVDVDIDDAGLRNSTGDSNMYTTPQQLKFSTPSQRGTKNILFTSQWDNYPKQAIVPLSGRSSHAYFLMAGSTNAMQSRMINGEIIIRYSDGSADTLQLKNPETWWPIEQDYDNDGYAFNLNAARPPRVYIKSGVTALNFDQYKGIKGYATKGIDGGAATILDLPLDPHKELKNLELKTLCNDVVIGLMAVTLIRP